MELWKEIGIGHLALKVLLTCTTTTDKVKFNEMQNLVTNFDKLSMDDLRIYGIVCIFQEKIYIYTNKIKILFSYVIITFTDSYYAHYIFIEIYRLFRNK